MQQITKSILKNIYKSRPANSRKYDYGLLLVIGGSQFYTGSPALSAMAAFRAGVDMVRIIAPKRAADIIASFSPNLAAYPLEGHWLEEKHVPTLVAMTEAAKEVSRGKTAVVIGGGLGRSEATQKAILSYLSQIKIPAVIDADAIHALAKNPELAKGKNFLITPHSFEFFILTGEQVAGLSDKGRANSVKEQASRLQTTLLLKGKMDLLGSSDGQKIAANKTGTPYMTCGGTGDTLAGIAGALLARGLNPFIAGAAAAYINGAAGSLAARTTNHGLTATDLIEAIPRIIA